MNVKKCDRCYKFYTPYKPKTITLECNTAIISQEVGNGYEGERYFDLCEDCMLKLIQFLNEKPE